MKRILACLSAALFAFGVNAATLVPIQLLNPAGSTSGQAIISSGPSSAPAWGGVPVSGFAAIAANTVLANATGSSAAPTAFAMPSCSAAGSALNWTASTGFTCASGYALLTGGTYTGPIIINDPSTSNLSSLKVAATSDTSGANLLMVGNGATTPAKTIRVLSGNFQILNNAYSSSILTLTDAGALSVPTVSATSSAHLAYNKSTAQSLTGTAAAITGWTSEFDLNSNFNATTGTFTAPVTGYYQISGQIAVTLSSPPVGSQTQAQVFANGVNVATSIHVAGATTESVSALPFSVLVSLTAGQTVQIFGYSSTTFSTAANASINFLSIVQVP